MLTAEDLIEKLELKPLPMEGGFYRETYRSSEIIGWEALPKRYSAEKAFATAIYYLLTPETKSLLHRLPTDEIFHFYLGDPVRMLLLHPDGKGETIVLGPNLESGQRLQFVVPQGVWQGSYLIEGGRFALMGTTMSPGFDFEDFESGEREHLTEIYPKYINHISKLATR